MANKFVKNLTASNADIKGKRSEVVARRAKASQSNLVNKLQDEKDELELIVERLSDLFPDSTVSLKVAENFDSNKWVKDMQDAKIALLNKEVELKAAKETYKEWFEELEEETTNDGQN